MPYIFIQHPPHTIVRASALVEYGPGVHDATVSRGQKEDTGRLRFLHYNYRSYDKFEAKVRNVETWFAANTHLPPWWGWHWRRWIRLKEAGRLREEYDSQFVTPARRDELIRDGTCTIDKTVTNFIKRRNSAARPSLPRRMFARLFGGPD